MFLSSSQPADRHPCRTYWLCVHWIVAYAEESARPFRDTNRFHRILVDDSASALRLPMMCEAETRKHDRDWFELPRQVGIDPRVRYPSIHLSESTAPMVSVYNMSPQIRSILQDQRRIAIVGQL